MTKIVRDALDREFNQIASLAVAAYQEYARALTVDNWEIMRLPIDDIWVSLL